MENREAFFALIRAGLWDNYESVSGERLAVCDSDVLRLAEEQSVIGLMAAGVEKLSANSIPLTEKLMLLGKCQLVEQRNAAMNSFVAELIQKLHETGIKAVLLKGQGVAQCYERSLWRTCGDIDLFLSENNFEKAKEFLQPLASHVDKEADYSKHLEMIINSWTVELHGYLRCGLSKRIDRVLDEIRQDVFQNNSVRTWMNGSTQVLLPSADNDVVNVFTHILNHFYKGGIGLKQLCDWCRLLWTFRDTIDVSLLEFRLQQMCLSTEWKAFAAFAVDYLGMQVDAMPLYSSEKKWKRKAKRICSFIMEVGNMGHNRDMSYYNTKPYLIQKAISVRYRCVDLLRHLAIFPLDSIRFFPRIMINGLRSAARGE